MLEMATGHSFLQDDADAPSSGSSGLLPIAERLDLLEPIAIGPVAPGAGPCSGSIDRARALILLRGAHELAVANDLVDVDRNTRTSLTFYEQFADPAAGLALAREGLEIASRPGRPLRLPDGRQRGVVRHPDGEWDWAAALLDEWLANEITGGFYLELFVDRAVLTALRGGDPSADIAEAERLVADFMGDPQYPSYVSLGAGVGSPRVPVDSTKRREHADGAADTTGTSSRSRCPSRPGPPSGPATRRGARADRPTRGIAHPRPGDRPRPGHAPGRASRRSRVAGPRRSPATATPCAAGAQLGLAFDEALAALDLAILLAPTEREMAEAPAAHRLGARDADPARGDAAPGPAGRGDGRSRCRGPDGRRRSRTGAVRVKSPRPSVRSRAGCEAAFEAIQDQVEAERELEVVVASAQDALVADRPGQLRDARVPLGHHLGEARRRFG